MAVYNPRRLRDLATLAASRLKEAGGVTLKHCHQCNYNRPEAEVIAGLCLTCRSEAVNDERPVSTLLSTLMFRQAKPQPRKSVGARAQGAYSQPR